MVIRGSSDAQRRAVQKHDTEKVDKVTVRLPKGAKERILSVAESVNKYAIQAIIEKLERDIPQEPEEDPEYNSKNEITHDPWIDPA